MKRILLNEYRTSEPVSLTLQELAALRRLVPQVSVSPSGLRPDLYELTPESHVGVVRIGETVIEIRPKVSIDRFFFLLSYAIDPAAWMRELVRLDAEDSVLEAVAPAYCRLVARATHRGLLHGYRTEEEALPLVRGQIRFRDQILRRHGMALPVEVRYEDFSPDIDENRILLAALHRLSLLPIRGTLTRRGLREVADAFHAVALVRMARSQVPAVHINRLNEHYRHALDLARMILEWTSLELGDTGKTGTAFLVDMNVVFERFLHRAIRECLGLTEAEFPSGRRVCLDTADRVNMEPDLSWWRDGRCLFVGDAKYKRVHVSGIRHPDLYQMLAYLVATGLPAGVLVYAAGEGEPVQHVVRHAGKVLIVKNLNLQDSPDGLLSQVAGIGRLIRRLDPRKISAGAPIAMP